MIIREMKLLIRYVIELDIDHIETFLGYEGDSVLKVKTNNQKTLKEMEQFIKNFGLQYKKSFELSSTSGSHVLHIGIEDGSLYKLNKG